MEGHFAFVVCFLLIYKVLALQEGLDRAGEPQCNSRVDFNLKVLENIASLKAAEKGLRHTVATLQETVNTLQEKDLPQTVATLQETVATLQETNRNKPNTVAFMAHLSADMAIEPLGDTHVPIVFDQVSVNVGNAYNKYTGVFTAPYKALYYFGIEISSPSRSESQGLHVHLFRNDQKIGYLFLDGFTRYWIRRTSGVTVLLDVGDAVRAVVSSSTGSKATTVAGSLLHSHLSGFLIGPDL